MSTCFMMQSIPERDRSTWFMMQFIPEREKYLMHDAIYTWGSDVREAWCNLYLRERSTWCVMQSIPKRDNYLMPDAIYTWEREVLDAWCNLYLRERSTWWRFQIRFTSALAPFFPSALKICLFNNTFILICFFPRCLYCLDLSFPPLK